MIAVDTSSLIAFLGGSAGADVELIDVALARRQAVLPPVVLTEVLSDPGLDDEVRASLHDLPILEIVDGFWQRAGALRAAVLKTGRKARIADALIAQSCLDHQVPLITRDRDFRHFARLARLDLIVDD